MAKLIGLQQELEDILTRDPARSVEALSRELVLELRRLGMTSAYEDNLDECRGCNGYPPGGQQWCKRCRPDRSADARLARLPEALRTIAGEFIDLHQAWETEFEVSNGYCMELQWANRGEGPDDSCARFEWYAKSYAFVGAGSAWSVLCREFRPGTHDEVEGVRVNSHGPLRYLPEFAAFVQRFKAVQ